MNARTASRTTGCSHTVRTGLAGSTLMRLAWDRAASAESSTLWPADGSDDGSVGRPAMYPLAAAVLSTEPGIPCGPSVAASTRVGQPASPGLSACAYSTASDQLARISADRSEE